MELLGRVKEKKPNLTVLVGPFLDERHPDVKRGEIGEREINSLLSEKINEIENSGSAVLLLSSARDFVADPIYPTPTIQSHELRCTSHMTGDPAYIVVNGWKVAITSNDIIFQLVRAESTKNATQKDKFTRVGACVLKSLSILYHIYLDWRIFDQFQYTDAYQPSALRCFLRLRQNGQNSLSVYARRYHRNS